MDKRLAKKMVSRTISTFLFIGLVFAVQPIKADSLTITLLSPVENKIYATASIPLTFTVSEPTSWIGYSLDSEANITITGNTTLTLSEGWHSIVVFANDTAGNMVSSETHFVVDTIPPVISDVSQTPPKENVYTEDEVEVEAVVQDDIFTGTEVKRVTLNYTNGNGTWIAVDMEHGIIGPQVYHWTATIPVFPYGTNVIYIIIAEDYAGNTITTQEMGYDYEYQVIPEFPTLTSILLVFIVSAIVIAIRKLRLLKTQIH